MSFTGCSTFDIKNHKTFIGLQYLWHNPAAENLCLRLTLSDQRQARFIKTTVTALAQKVKELDVPISCYLSRMNKHFLLNISLVQW